MKLTLLSVVAFVCVALTSASANTITFDFSSATGTSTTAIFTGSDGTTISATGTSNLFFKTGGGDETGLGLAGTSQNEIGVGQSITFDLSSLFNKGVTDLTLGLGSVQSGEVGTACDDFGSCVTFTASGTMDITGLFAEMQSKGDGTLKITATSGNVLIDSLTATTIPEPSSLLLLGTGVFAMAGAVRKKLPF